MLKVVTENVHQGLWAQAMWDNRATISVKVLQKSSDGISVGVRVRKQMGGLGLTFFYHYAFLTNHVKDEGLSHGVIRGSTSATFCRLAQV